MTIVHEGIIGQRSSVGEVDAGERVDDSSVAILKLRFGTDFLPESCILVEILKLKIVQDFEVEFQLRF